MKSLTLITLILLTFSLSSQQSLSATYIGGNQGTILNVYEESCTELIAIQLPPEDFYIVTGIDVEYNFQSVGGPYTPDQQRSYLEFTNNGTTENEINGPVFFFNNLVEYNRTSLNIANGEYVGGTVLNFRLWLKSENLLDLSVTNCDASRHYVVGGSWKVTVHFQNAPKIGINKSDPEALLDVNGKVMIADDDLAPKEGMLRYDATSQDYQGHDGTDWKSFTKSRKLTDSDNDTEISVEDAPGSDSDNVKIKIAGLDLWEFNDQRIIPSVIGNNISIGENSGGSGGENNISVGKGALENHQNGSYNIAVGPNALKANVSGTDNIAIGPEAAASLQDGANNIAIGRNAMQVDGTTISNTVAIGNNTNSNYEVGSNSVVIGVDARKNFSDSGDSIVAIGFQSIARNRSVAIGANTFASQNSVVIGNFSGANGKNSISIGASNYPEDESIAIGTEINLQGFINAQSIAMGHRAISAPESVSIGWEVFGGSTSVTLGHKATSGAGAVAIGTEASANSNAIAVGKNVSAALNNVRIGAVGTTSIGGPQAWTNLSDKRFKQNIQDDVPGLSFIKELKPVTYNLNLHQYQRHLNGNAYKSESNADKMLYSGFLAQDVDVAAKRLGYDFYGVDRPSDESGAYGIRYSIFVVPLVKAVQEQQEIILEQGDRIELLEDKLARLENLIFAKN